MLSGPQNVQSNYLIVIIGKYFLSLIGTLVASNKEKLISPHNFTKERKEEPMKKLSLCMVTLFVVMVAASAYALPLWDGGGFGYDGRDYTVYDRSDGTDTYDGTYFGYTGGDYTGYYLGTIGGNTEPSGLWDAITYYYLGLTGEDIALSSSYKVEDGSGTDGPLTVVAAGDLKSGTWEMDDPFALGFYGVKGANEFALYYVDPALQSGDWTTRHLLTGGATVPAISHFSGVPTTKTRVPEPAALIWLGFGLLGLAGASKPFLKK
jgi:hypothetical protein